MLLQELLSGKIDLKRTKMMRHAGDVERVGVHWQKGYIEIYQSIQNAKRLANCDYVISFIGAEGYNSKFLGVYEVNGYKPFKINKFRTMYSNPDNKGALLTEKDDPRVTPYGRFLRKYRLDELPQFWNVLIGEMSLVGPRPEQRYYIDRIVKKAPYYYLLHNVRPGITSWGMVKYGYAETVDKMIERLYYDVLYYENMSIVLDIKIIIYTIQIVFTGKGV